MQARKRKLVVDKIATTEARSADQAASNCLFNNCTLPERAGSVKKGNLVVRKVTEKIIPTGGCPSPKACPPKNEIFFSKRKRKDFNFKKNLVQPEAMPGVTTSMSTSKDGDMC